MTEDQGWIRGATFRQTRNEGSAIPFLSGHSGFAATLGRQLVHVGPLSLRDDHPQMTRP